MEIISYIFMIFYVYQYCIKEAGPTYVLLRGTRSDVERECSRSNGGSITIFRGDLPDELIGVLRNDSSVSIWNGYKYTSPLVENTGCFEKIGSHPGFNITSPDLTIAYCEHFCNRHEIAHFAIQESHCFCVEPEGIDSNYESRPIADCNYTCNMKPDEYCGSNRNSTIYNIYSVVEPYEESNIFTDIYTSGEGLCLLYKLRQGEINASVCDDDSANRIACRSIDNTVEWIYNRSDKYTWGDSLYRCLDLRKSKSYLASYSDIWHEKWGKVWLNERKYRTFVENKTGDESLKRCQAIFVENGEICFNESKCDALEGVHYACKTDTNNQKHSTSTLSYHQNESSDIKHSPVKSNDSGDGVRIGGEVESVILIAVVGGIALVLVFKRRHSIPCYKESKYQSQEVSFSTSNSAYDSESTYDTIQGNEDRNSQGDYTNINDEDLRISETDKRKRNADDMEYDHLRQEAYEHNFADENMYNHVDTDNEYSHISQITKTNDNHKHVYDDDDDDYTHAGNFELHSGTSVKNELEDAYAHANDNGVDMTEARPYELAQNVHRHETDTYESKPNAYAQLNTEDGDYSLAKPID